MSLHFIFVLLKGHVLGTWENLMNLQKLCVKEQETRHSQENRVS